MVVKLIGLPLDPTVRALEDLTAHGLVVRHSVDGNRRNKDRWSLAPWSRLRLDTVGYQPLRAGHTLPQ